MDSVESSLSGRSASQKTAFLTTNFEESCVSHSYLKSVLADFYKDMSNVLKRVEFVEESINTRHEEKIAIIDSVISNNGSLGKAMKVPATNNCNDNLNKNTETYIDNLKDFIKSEINEEVTEVCVKEEQVVKGSVNEKPMELTQNSASNKNNSRNDIKTCKSSPIIINGSKTADIVNKAKLSEPVESSTFEGNPNNVNYKNEAVETVFYLASSDLQCKQKMQFFNVANQYVGEIFSRLRGKEATEIVIDDLIAQVKYVLDGNEYNQKIPEIKIEIEDTVESNEQCKIKKVFFITSSKLYELKIEDVKYVARYMIDNNIKSESIATKDLLALIDSFNEYRASSTSPPKDSSILKGIDEKSFIKKESGLKDSTINSKDRKNKISSGKEPNKHGKRLKQDSQLSNGPKYAKIEKVIRLEGRMLPKEKEDSDKIKKVGKFEDLEKLSGKIEDLLCKIKKTNLTNGKPKYMAKCKLCSKEGRTDNIKTHILGAHPTFVKSNHGAVKNNIKPTSIRETKRGKSCPRDV